MKLSLFKPIAPIVLALSFIVLFGPGSSRAQGQKDLSGGSSLVNGTSRTDLAGAGSSRSSSSGVGTIGRAPVGTKTRYTNKKQNVAQGSIPVKPKPMTGTLVVVAEPNATVLIEPVNGLGEAKEGKVPPGEKSFIFVNLKPGRYRVEASLDNHKNAETEVNVTTGKKPEDVTLNLPPITYTVTINTNVRSGEIRYAPVEGKLDSGTGETIYTAQPGTTRLATIQSDGKANLPELPPGTYGVDIRPDEVGYQTLLRRFTVPGETSYTISLEKKLSEGQLLANWDTLKRSWEVPANWNVTSVSLQVRGIKPPMTATSYAENGMAVTRNEDFRYYADFDLQSDIKMRKSVGASFVVHAKDARNYYLVQLTGANADEPFVLRGFIVTGGVRRSFSEPQSIRAFSSALSSGQPFTVTMKMRGNKLSVFLTDNESGRTQPAGVLTDPNSVYPIGAVGIAGSDNEEFEVVSFILCKGCIR